MVIGKAAKLDIGQMKLGGQDIQWCQSVKYLGVYLMAGMKLCFDISPVKRAFYSACNSIFSHGNGLDEIALLHLQEVYSLSVLMYATPVLLLKVRQISELNVCWNMVIRKIFGYHKWESVRTVIDGLGRVDVTHLIQLRKITFYRRIFNTMENSVLCRLFWVFLNRSNLYDDCMLAVFHDKAVSDVFNSFSSSLH